MTKPTKWLCAQRRLRPVWWESSLCVKWTAFDPRFIHADSEDSDRWAHSHLVGFVMSRLKCSFPHAISPPIVKSSSLCCYSLSVLLLFVISIVVIVVILDIIIVIALTALFIYKEVQDGLKKPHLSRDMTKQTKWLYATRRLRSAWASARPSLCAQWVAKDPSVLHSDSEDYDQTGWIPRLICLRWAHTHFVGFVMSRLNYTHVRSFGSLFWHPQAQSMCRRYQTENYWTVLSNITASEIKYRQSVDMNNTLTAFLTVLRHRGWYHKSSAEIGRFF